jgi:hypothetical protein
MKLCLYCKAEIPEDAIKCMHCTSTLVPSNTEAEQKNGRVTYILDRDLIRFGKFTIAGLAMFLTVGAFLYGFDIKQTAKEVRDAQQDAAKLIKEIREAQQSIARSKADVEALVANAQGSSNK